jgi:Tol biopolymer transport system component
VINPDNSQRLKLANGSGPVFSPASKRIAYREITSDSGSDELVVAIKSISLDGSNKQIYCLLGAGTGMLIRWSPDSRYIASARWQTGVMAT